MTNYRTHKGWQIETGIGNGANLPQEYHRNIYADVANKVIYSGDTLSEDWDEYDHPGIKIATVWHPHPYYDKPDYITRDELVAMAEEAITDPDSVARGRCHAYI